MSDLELEETRNAVRRMQAWLLAKKRSKSDYNAVQKAIDILIADLHSRSERAALVASLKEDKMSEWKPINTAPDNGSVFLAVDDFGQQWLCAKINEKVMGIGQKYCTMAKDVANNATHWIPLPKSPNQIQMIM